MTSSEEDARLLEKAAAWTGSASTVGAAIRAGGLEFATAVLHDRILRVRANAEFLRAACGPAQPAKICADLIAVVPGAFHREHRKTGADGERVLTIARELGCKAARIPTSSFGTLDENARVILEWLASRREERIALVSLSKGGADVKRALSFPEAAASVAAVSAWVSFSGIVQGTPLVDWLRRQSIRWWGVRLWLWWHRYRARALDELRHGPGTTLARWPAISEHLRLVHVCGFPIERHLAHPWAIRGYTRLSPLGPNDGGGILLTDLLELPGIVCPIWGADHYLTPRWDILPLLTGIISTALTAPEHEHTKD